MTTWFTADLHIGHARIIELCGRPFADADEMNEAIVQRWNERVAPADQVYVLGDVALGKITASLALVEQLNGLKLLVPGNHDRCWSGHKKVRPVDVTRYTDVGFVLLPELARHGDWWLCHFPTAGDSHDQDRYADHRPVIPEGDWLIHGHVHEKWRVNGRQINVGVDVWDFAPVSEDELCALAVPGGHPV